MMLFFSLQTCHGPSSLMCAETKLTVQSTRQYTKEMMYQNDYSMNPCIFFHRQRQPLHDSCRDWTAPYRDLPVNYYNGEQTLFSSSRTNPFGDGDGYPLIMLRMTQCRLPLAIKSLLVSTRHATPRHALCPYGNSTHRHQHALRVTITKAAPCPPYSASGYASDDNTSREWRLPPNSKMSDSKRSCVLHPLSLPYSVMHLLPFVSCGCIKSIEMTQQSI